MNWHLWAGERLSDDQLKERLQSMEAFVGDSLRARLSLEKTLEVLDRFSILLKDNPPSSLVDCLVVTEGSLERAWSVLEEIGAFCSREFLEEKVIKELGSLDAVELTRVSFARPLFEQNAPLGLVTHILPGNSTGLSVLACLESLLVGNSNILKLSSRESDFALLALEELGKIDLSGSLARKVCVLRASSSDRDILMKLFQSSDAVSAWGGDTAISQIKAMLPPGVRFIPWGHKMSFGIVAKGSLKDEEGIRAIALDVVREEQQACSSPQNILVETEDFGELEEFASRFYKVLKEESDKFSVTPLKLAEQAEITNMVQMVELDQVWGKAKLFEDEKKTVRVLVEKELGLRPSPLFRTVWVRPFQASKLLEQLRPWRSYLQTASLLCPTDGRLQRELTMNLLRSGALRVTRPGQMLETYSGEPHDGVFALQRLTKRVRAELPGREKSFRLASEDQEGKPVYSYPIMGKEEFQRQMPNDKYAHLYFKSGGSSSGESKLSVFSYRDYHVQMQAAAEGLLAVGLEPLKDRCMNLFFGGGLYGGFLSFHSILEKLKVTQYPMSAIDDWDFVGEMIVKGEVNVLFGMPSYLMSVIRHNWESLKKYRGIKKIFYGGESFSQKNIDWLKRELGVQLIASASYGSVDAGPIGFQCSHCEGGAHHLNAQLHNLEILNLETDESVDPGETGRLVITTHHRQALEVKRYDIGDLGRWIEGDCPCGDRAPRFEFLGRYGDVFRAGGTFYHYAVFDKVLREKMNFEGEFQVEILREKSNEGRDIIELSLETGWNNSIQTSDFLAHYRDLELGVVKERAVDFKIRYVENKDFKRAAHSGKLIRVRVSEGI